MKIKKNDNVIVLAGKDRGKTGKVSKVFHAIDKVLIDGVNIAKFHQKPRRNDQKGQIVLRPRPIHVSNVAFIDPKTKKATRLGYKIEGDKKVRIAKKSGTTV